jgi:SagB-type dehydrogenase family enzyme
VTNQRTEIAREYHESTKLTYINLRNKPPLYKVYSKAPTIPLPVNFRHPNVSTLEAVSGLIAESGEAFTLETLAALLYFSAGVVRKRVLPEVGEVHYRAAASAGALYPIETYVACQDIPGLEAGVYHFSPAEFTLRQLRQGDYRGMLATAAGSEETIIKSAVTFIFTSIFWRSTWKYRTRGYRYCFWDNGTIVANLTAMASALGVPARLVVGFVDHSVDQLLGIDGEKEASICLVPVGKNGSHPTISPSLHLSTIEASSVSPTTEEIAYPEIHQTHNASLLLAEDEASDWKRTLTFQSSQNWESLYLESSDENRLNPKDLEQVIAERGSTRRFARGSISFSHLSALLDKSTKGLSADFLRFEGESLLDLYLIVNSVEGLPPGAYCFAPEQGGLELLQEGNFREEAGHLCFEQALGADASAVVFFLADLERIWKCYGNRGYRAAQLEAGIVGGKLYLCAYSLGLGASGITFYDDEITDFFSPHAAGKSVMFVVTLGKTARPNRVRPFRSRIGAKLDALARGAGQV